MKCVGASTDLHRFEHMEPITSPTGGVDMFGHYRNEEFGLKTRSSDKPLFPGPKSFAFSLTCSETGVIFCYSSPITHSGSYYWKY